MRRCPPISIHALREEGDAFWLFLQYVSRLDFYPRPPRGGRHVIPAGESLDREFLSTPSARRATRSHNGLYIIRKYFYPRPPRGGRRRGDSPAVEHQKFLSTPSARRATGDPRNGNRPEKHFYPRPPRGGRLTFHLFCGTLVLISIHALREEGDRHHQRIQDARLISIHALREEGDVYLSCLFHRPSLFLSTPSARRATRLSPRNAVCCRNFYPRPPRGGRHGWL